MNDRNRCGSRAVRVVRNAAPSLIAGYRAEQASVCLLNTKQRCQACSVLGGSSARATPSTTTRLLPCSTQRVSNTARRPTTRVAWTVACSTAPTSAVPRKASRCVRYSEPGCARSQRQRRAYLRVYVGPPHQTRADDGGKQAGCKQARHDTRLQARSLCGSLCPVARSRGPHERMSAHVAQPVASQRTHRLGVHWVGVSSERCERSDVCRGERAALLEHGASHQVARCVAALRRARAAAAAGRRAQRASAAHPPLSAGRSARGGWLRRCACDLLCAGLAAQQEGCSSASCVVSAARTGGALRCLACWRSERRQVGPSRAADNQRPSRTHACCLQNLAEGARGAPALASPAHGVRKRAAHRAALSRRARAGATRTATRPRAGRACCSGGPVRGQAARVRRQEAVRSSLEH